jgi:DNA-binding MarR family transcriptional regulator
MFDYAALADFRHHLRRFLAFSEAAAKGAGVEPQQHQMLLALKGLPPETRPTIKNVAERLLIKHHSAVELADRLQAHGLVDKTAGDDKRETHLVITARGERVLRKLTDAHREELRTLAPALVDALDAVLGHGARPRGRARAGVST